MAKRSSILQRAVDKGKLQAFLLLKDVLQRASRSLNDCGEKQVVFVAGVQRSGTNMMMDVLERSLQTQVFHESDPRAFDGYEMRPPDIIRKLVDASPAQCIVIKALCDLPSLKSLLDQFAPARAIWMVRDFDDVVNSHLQLWTGMPESVRQIVEEGGTAGWRGRGMSDATRAILKDHYRPDLDNPSACALFWFFRNVLYFEQGLDRDPRVQLVRYEEVVVRPQYTFPAIFSFLDLPYTRRVSRAVFASSVRKASKPDIAPAIRELCQNLDSRFARVAAMAEDVSPR